MSDPTFLSEIEKEVVRQVEAILEKGHTERERLLGDAQKEAKQVEERLTHKTDLEIRKLESRFQTQENLESRRDLLRLKSKYVDKALDGARDAFDALKDGKEYEAIYKKFFSELAQSLNGHSKKIVIRVHPEDEKITKSLLHDLKLSGEVKTDSSVQRGLEMENSEGNLRVRNTFDSRLREAREEIIQRLNEVLFKEM